MPELNLNQFLQSNDSPLVNRPAESGYEFDANTERSAISATHIKNFSFTSGRGGNLVLGGLDNGNGVLQVVDAGGTERVLINNEGITVNNGSIVVKNSSGSVIMNQTGLTTVNFASDGTLQSGVVSTSGTAFSTVGSITLDFDMAKTSNTLFLATTMARNELGTTTTSFQINLYKSGDGTTYVSDRVSQSWYVYESTGSPFVNKFQSGQLFHEVDGSGTFTHWRAALEWLVSAGTAYCYDRQLNYVILGS